MARNEVCRWLESYEKFGRCVTTRKLTNCSAGAQNLGVDKCAGGLEIGELLCRYSGIEEKFGRCVTTQKLS